MPYKMATHYVKILIYKKRGKSYNIGRTFLPLFPRFYKGSIKTVRQSVY